ncbi:MAG: hypothetical protein HOV68_07175 [Streptomycetaceae bacterium]|nr:hypothetical protein [Streptomycetaceae bacterium]
MHPVEPRVPGAAPSAVPDKAVEPGSLNAWLDRVRRNPAGRVLCWFGRLFVSAGSMYVCMPPDPETAPEQTATSYRARVGDSPALSTPGPRHPERLRPDIPLTPLEQALARDLARGRRPAR